MLLHGVDKTPIFPLTYLCRGSLASAVARYFPKAPDGTEGVAKCHVSDENSRV